MINQGWIVAGHDISAGGLITTLLEMCFNVEGGLELCLDTIAETDLVKLLFAENPGVVVQVREPAKVERYLTNNGIGFAYLGAPAEERQILLEKDGAEYLFGIDHLRDVWFESSYLLERKQSTAECAKARFENYSSNPAIQLSGNVQRQKFSSTASARTVLPNSVKAAIIREKGERRP